MGEFLSNDEAPIPIRVILQYMTALLVGIFIHNYRMFLPFWQYPFFKNERFFSKIDREDGNKTISRAISSIFCTYFAFHS
jgi:hypothetical protein